MADNLKVEDTEEDGGGGSGQSSPPDSSTPENESPDNEPPDNEPPDKEPPDKEPPDKEPPDKEPLAAPKGTSPSAEQGSPGPILPRMGEPSRHPEVPHRGSTEGAHHPVPVSPPTPGDAHAPVIGHIHDPFDVEGAWAVAGGPLVAVDPADGLPVPGPLASGGDSSGSDKTTPSAGTGSPTPAPTDANPHATTDDRAPAGHMGDGPVVAPPLPDLDNIGPLYQAPISNPSVARNAASLYSESPIATSETDPTLPLLHGENGATLPTPEASDSSLEGESLLDRIEDGLADLADDIHELTHTVVERFEEAEDHNESPWH